jgi:protein SCO1
MRTFLIILFLTVLASAQTVENPLETGFDSQEGTQVPLELVLTDEQGRERTVEELLDGKPVLLVLGYYGCPMLCHEVQKGLLEGLSACRFTVGKEFRVFTVSVDPTESSELAAEKKLAYLKAYQRGDAEGWPFLVGESEQLEALQSAVGFRSSRLEDQIAHPAGLVVLTPSGKVSSYLYGLRFPAVALEQAIEKAAEEETGSFLRPVLLLCYQYDPATGRYSLAIYRIVQLLGALTVLILVAAVAYWVRKERRPG